MSDQSSTGLSDRSLRPAVFGTLTAADAGARGSFQMPGRSPGAGIISFASNGIFNLPRYYPTYRRFDNDDDDDSRSDGRSTWRSGEHQRTIPFYHDQSVDDDNHSEPIYAKPNKASRRAAGSADGVLPVSREQFTIALGSDLDSPSSGGRRCRDCYRCNCCSRSCCNKSSCCHWPCTRSCSRCRCCSRRPLSTVKSAHIGTIVALSLLTFITIAVVVAVIVYSVVINPGIICHPVCDIANFLEGMVNNSSHGHRKFNTLNT